jgi:hypothetical protein
MLAGAVNPMGRLPITFPFASVAALGGSAVLCR